MSDTYLDSGIIMRSIEVPAHQARALVDRGSCATSVVAITECLTGPLRLNSSRRVTEFMAFFQSSDLLVYDVSRPLATFAAELRATHGLRTPDAIHLATVLAAGCSRFATTDLVFDKPSIRSLIQVDLLPS